MLAALLAQAVPCTYNMYHSGYYVDLQGRLVPSDASMFVMDWTNSTRLILGSYSTAPINNTALAGLSE
jgi:hypothetical protein